MRRLVLAATALLLVVGAVAPALAVGATPDATAAATQRSADVSGGQAQVSATDADWCPTDRPAPESDTLGWENGCWWDADIQVDRSDGLNDSELRKVVGRAMARVEKVRKLEFQRDVPVEVISREQHREEFAAQYNYSTDATLRENVVLEGSLLVGEDESAVAAQKQMFGASALGYYDPATGNITIISENTTTPKLNEITLSQELFHALQDERWNISRYDRDTWEDMNAVNGIIEGDGNYVDHLYKQRCQAEWDCLERQGQAGGGGDIHYGIYTLFLQSYSDGPAFVAGLREAGGWEAVNAVYETPPASTEQTINPDRYPDEAPVNVSISDTSSEAWRVPEPANGSARYGKLGEAGLYVMFLYPTLESSGAVRPEMAQSFYNADSAGELQSMLDPYNYSYHASEGWAGDKLLPYVTDDSAETNETGYVWKLRWDSEADAEQFVADYHWLLEHWGATTVDGHVDTYRIPDEKQFGDAFYVNQSGQAVTIVNAPTVEQLSAVHEGAAPTGTDNDTDVGDGGPTATPTESSDGAIGPGFGLLTALVALAALLVVAVGRRR
ncbi:Hvo_1808 family surface protein [Halobacteriales archaeon Cl-PHB]